jgi:hypothetical protein
MVTIVLVSLNLAMLEHSFILSKKSTPLQYRLLFQTRQRYHPLSFVGRLHIVGAILRRIFYD